MGQAKMKTYLRAAAAVALLALGGCAAGDPTAGHVDLAAAVPAASAGVTSAPPQQSAALGAAPRRVVRVARAAPVLRGLAGASCPWARSQVASAAAPRPLGARRLYRFTNY
jgi:hypothetical protein